MLHILGRLFVVSQDSLRRRFISRHRAQTDRAILSYELPDGTSSLLAPNVSTRKLCSSQDASGIHDNSSFMKRDVDSCNTAITRPMHRNFSELVDGALYGRRRLLSLPGEQCWCVMPLLLKLVKVLSPLCVIAGSWHFGLHDKPEHSVSTRDGSFSCCLGHALTLQGNC